MTIWWLGHLCGCTWFIRGKPVYRPCLFHEAARHGVTR